MWRRYLKLAQGYTAAHPMESSATPRTSCGTCAPRCSKGLRGSDVQVACRMGHSKIETTKNIYYGHPFAQDRTFILDAMNQ